jgi:hypothetical protein
MRVSATIVLLILITVWAGVIIGVSFIATPIKFQAPSLTLQTGAEIGRYTFRLLSRIELCFLVAAIAAAGLARPRWITIVALLVVTVELAVQRYWLLPVLDQRVSRLLAGAAPSSSIHHSLYAVMEAVKTALLITSAVVEFRSKLRS